MAKNRKSRSAAVRFGPACRAFLCCLVLGGSGLGYVWQKSQIHHLGREIKERETTLAQLRRENKMRSDNLAALCSAPALEARIKKLNLGLIQPEVTQVVRLREPVVETGTVTQTMQVAKSD